MPGKESKEERTFKGLGCATPDPHLRSDYILTGMRAGCCTSDWKWGVYSRYVGLIEADCSAKAHHFQMPLPLNINGLLKFGFAPTSEFRIL